jgi:hypothetical protein
MQSSSSSRVDDAARFVPLGVAMKLHDRSTTLLLTTGLLRLAILASTAHVAAASQPAAVASAAPPHTATAIAQLDASTPGDVVLSTAVLSNAAQNPAQIAFNFFVRKGLTNVQAAGIIGNLMQESGMNPASVQLNIGRGRGIAQWEVGGRWDMTPNNNLTWYASTHRSSRWALSTQLSFIWYELTTFGGYGLRELRAATTVAAATRVFEIYFEGCGICNESQRIAGAQAALRAYGRGVRIGRA